MASDISNRQDIDTLIANLAPDSHRRQLIDAARSFKSNWVTFGEYLTRVASEKRYLEWGYRSFEEYCRLEIRIRKSTAIKLTNAYFFATESEPSISGSFESKGVPELDVVNFLHKARADETCSDEMFEALKEGALEKGESGTTLARRLKQMKAPVGDAAMKQAMEQALTLVNRLQQKLSPESGYPAHFQDHLSEISSYLNDRISSEVESDIVSRKEIH